MFGPYEIEYEGRRYFGNASLREFHIFNYDGNPYLIDVELWPHTRFHPGWRP